jgi:membrane associated rhomboid family serine protease
MFLPLKDINPTQRTPYVTVGLIAVNILAFFYEFGLGDQLHEFLMTFGAVPYRITHAEGTPAVWFTLVSSMFLHGGLMHLFGNMLYLWIFGNNIEDILGPVKFLLFYLACGLVASFAHIASAPSSTIPTIGASGAVAGVLGAYLIAYPHARVVSLLFLFFFIRLVVVPAKYVLLFWFIIQAFQGVASLSTRIAGGVAWWAHVGGFLAGLIAIKLIAADQLRVLKAAREWGDDFYRRGR